MAGLSVVGGIVLLVLLDLRRTAVSAGVYVEVLRGHCIEPGAKLLLSSGSSFDFFWGLQHMQY